MSVYAGIDVHRNRSQVAVINEGGKVLVNRNVPNGVKPVLSVIGRLPAGTPAAYEAAFGGGWLPGAAGKLRLRAAHGAPAAVQGDRLRASSRTTRPVPQRSRSCCAPACCPRRGSPRRRSASCGRCCATGRSWSGCGRCCATGSVPSSPATATAARRAAGCGPGRAWLAALELPAVSRRITGDDLTLTDALAQPIGRLDTEVRQRGKAGPRARVLTQLPGAGVFTALVLLAEIGDISRFGSARKLAAWAGLTPTVRGSDRTVRHGHIPGQGPAWARWVLCEAAQTARRHPDFAPGCEALARRRGKKIATTAVARKLITRAYHLLTDAASDGAPG